MSRRRSRRSSSTASCASRSSRRPGRALQPDPADTAGRSATSAGGSTIPARRRLARLSSTSRERSSARCASANAGCSRASDRIVPRRPDRRRRPRLHRHQRDRRVTKRCGAEALFRTIVTRRSGVAHLDLDGRITLVNARFALIAGRAREAWSNLVFAPVHADDRALTSRRSTGPPVRHAVRDGDSLPAADGSIVWVSAS